MHAPKPLKDRLISTLLPAFASMAVFLCGCIGPLQKAAREGNTSEVLRLVSQEGDINVCGDCNYFTDSQWRIGSPLSCASFEGRIDTVKALLDKGADVNKDCHEGNQPVGRGSPLIYASSANQLDVAKILLAHGADVNIKAGYYGQGTPGSVCKGLKEPTALVIAAVSGYTDMVRLLLAHGADPNAYYISTSCGGSGSLEEISTQRGHPEIAQLIQEAKSRQHGAPTSVASKPVLPAASEPAEAPTSQAEVNSHSDVDKPSYSRPENADNFALVIGIDKYANLPEAEYAVHDATAVREHLRALGYPSRNIVYLEGPKATRTGIQSYLEEWLPRNVKPQSTVFLYYSGHGAPDPKTGDAYLVPWDADVKFLKTTAYPVKQLYASLNALNAKQVIVALDACFSGAGGRSVLAKGTRPLVTKVDAGFAPQGGMILFAAASGDEVTSTLDDQGHGMFTYFLLKGLNGEAKDASGQVSVKSLYDYLLPKVQDEAHRQNRDQTPQLLPASGAQADLILR